MSLHKSHTNVVKVGYGMRYSVKTFITVHWLLMTKDNVVNRKILVKMQFWSQTIVFNMTLHQTYLIFSISCFPDLAEDRNCLTFFNKYMK